MQLAVLIWSWYLDGYLRPYQHDRSKPLMGENLDDFGPRFPDMSKAYTPEYRATAHEVAKKLVSSLMKVSILV